MTDKYNCSKIYKIVSDSHPEFYIGSTTSTLSKRQYFHKGVSKRKPDIRVYRHIRENGGWDEWRLVLIDSCNLDSRDELLRMEERHRSQFNGNPLLLNSNMAHCGCETRSEYRKKWREQNPERYYSNQHEKYTCTICRVTILRRVLRTHERSRRHQLNLQEVKSI